MLDLTCLKLSCTLSQPLLLHYVSVRIVAHCSPPTYGSFEVTRCWWWVFFKYRAPAPRWNVPFWHSCRSSSPRSVSVVLLLSRMLHCCEENVSRSQDWGKKGERDRAWTVLMGVLVVGFHCQILSPLQCTFAWTNVWLMDPFCFDECRRLSKIVSWLRHDVSLRQTKGKTGG